MSVRPQGRPRAHPLACDVDRVVAWARGQAYKHAHVPMCLRARVLPYLRAFACVRVSKSIILVEFLSLRTNDSRGLMEVNDSIEKCHFSFHTSAVVVVVVVVFVVIVFVVVVFLAVRL